MPLKKAGLTNGEIINAATVNGAKAINKAESIGKLAKGFEASFVLLKQNPLDDINHIHTISEVYKSGVQVDRPALIAQNKAIKPQGPACNEVIKSRQAQNIIDDFTGDTPWQALSDSVMGGQSVATLTTNKNSLTIDTTITKPTSFGAWAG
eukprot:UN23269